MFSASSVLTVCWPLPQVNIIPVIAKADTIARSELPQFKARVRKPSVISHSPCISLSVCLCSDYGGAACQWSPYLPVPN